MRTLDGHELSELLHARAACRARRGGVLAGCLLAAWLIVRVLRGRKLHVASVWFGDGSSMACCFRCSRSASHSAPASRSKASCRRPCSGSRSDPAVTGRDSAQRAGSRRDLSEHAVGPRRRTQHFVGRLDRGDPVDHRHLPVDARRDGRRALEDRRDAVTLRNVVEGTLTAGVRAGARALGLGAR